nr:hypothetical protein [Armatimonadota bacterium]
LRAFASGSIPDLASALSSPYADIERAEGKLARKQISSCVRAQGDPWTHLGYLARDPDSVVPTWLDFCVSWRDEALSGARTLADWIRRFNLLMAGTPWLAACSGSGLVAKRDSAAQDAMVRSLLVSQLLGDSTRKLTLGEFVAHCEGRWQNDPYTIRSQTGVRVSTTPAGIGDASIVIALGMLEGRFPSRRAEDPILLDRDRDWLRQARTDWRLPSSYDRAAEDRREFYRVACAAPKIVFSYPLNFGETPEIRTSYLDELEADGITPSYTVKRYEDRFPKPHPSLSMSDLLGAQAWHDDETFDPGELVAHKQGQLRQAAGSASDALIANPEIKREMSALPLPLRLAHLRSLRQCPFQYFARAKLDLRSARPRWAWDCVANAVRKADVSADSADALRSNLMAALEGELSGWRGKAPQHELELVRVAAPKALSAFAEREISMRQKWGLRIKGQNVTLGEANLRSSVPLGGYSLNFSERIDVLYEREGTSDVAQLRLGRTRQSGPAGDPEFDLETSIITFLSKGQAERLSIVDSLESGQRLISPRSVSGGVSKLKNSASEGLFVDPSSDPLATLKSDFVEQLNGLLAIASRGDLTATPGVYCQTCEYPALCRQAQSSEVGSAQWGFDEE